MANVLGKVHTINARETTFFNANRTYDRIITDIPSFENRWPGTQGAGAGSDGANEACDGDAREAGAAQPDGRDLRVEVSKCVGAGAPHES